MWIGLENAASKLIEHLQYSVVALNNQDYSTRTLVRNSWNISDMYILSTIKVIGILRNLNESWNRNRESLDKNFQKYIIESQYQCCISNNMLSVLIWSNDLLHTNLNFEAIFKSSNDFCLKTSVSLFSANCYVDILHNKMLDSIGRFANFAL